MPTTCLADASAERDVITLQRTIRALASSPSDRLVIHVEGAGEADSVRLPAVAVHHILEVLELIARGDTPSVLNRDQEITTQAAADLLNVSRPTFVKMLEDGKIPFHRIGTHRRLKLADVLSYRESRSRSRMEALDQLLHEERELGLPD